MSDLLFKIRITSPDPDSAELLRQALKAAFGAALTLGKARKGSNPKYAHLDQVLAYGELELSRADLAVAAGLAPPAKAPAKAPARRTRKPAAPAPAPAPYTQQTIALSKPAKAPRRKKVQP